MKIERQQQRAEELCGASIRALTGQLDLRYCGRRLHKGLRAIRVRAPHLIMDPAKDDFGSYRGAADGIALRLDLSDAELHKNLSPEESIPQFVFELLEQLRVESLVPGRFPGMRSNLHHQFRHWCLSFHQSRLTENHVGILIYTLVQVVWSRLNDCAVLDATEGLIEETRFNLTPMIGGSLRGLRKHRQHQALYASHALAIAVTIKRLVSRESIAELENEQNSEEQDDCSELSLFLDLDGDDELEAIATVVTGESQVLAEADVSYRVFNNAYDKELEVAALIRPDYLVELRQRLDRLIRAQGLNIPRLARRLAALLASPQLDSWQFGQEEGYIDARRLSQLVSSPSEHHIFQQELTKPSASAFVTVLIDCSGSMKGHIEPVAVMVDALGRALEQAQAKTEILGYTTETWNGGRCQQEWLSKNRPKHPGRLNELSHLVYKSADTSWRRARPAIAGLLKADLFREGIDGEALEWACHRMVGCLEERRILIVISDGCPMDTATNLANDKFYLDNHLKQVVDRIEQAGEIEVFGLGVGLDLSPYYTHSLSLDLSQTLSNQVFEEIIQLLAGRHHR